MSSEPQNHDLRHDAARRRAVAGHRAVAGREGGDRDPARAARSRHRRGRILGFVARRLRRRQSSRRRSRAPHRRLACAHAQGGHRRRRRIPCGRTQVAHPRLHRHQPHPHGAQAPPRARRGRRADALGLWLRAQPRRRGRVLLRGRDPFGARVRSPCLRRGGSRRGDDDQPPRHGRLLPPAGIRGLPP